MPPKRVKVSSAAQQEAQAPLPSAPNKINGQEYFMGTIPKAHSRVFSFALDSKLTSSQFPESFPLALICNDARSQNLLVSEEFEQSQEAGLVCLLLKSDHLADDS